MLWPIIGKIFASYRGCVTLITGGYSLRISNKLYLSRN